MKKFEPHVGNILSHASTWQNLLYVMLDFCLFCIVEYFAMASRTIIGIVGILCATHRDGFISAEEIRGAVKVVNAQA